MKGTDPQMLVNQKSSSRIAEEKEKMQCNLRVAALDQNTKREVLGILRLDEDVQFMSPNLVLLESRVCRNHGVGVLNVRIVVDAPVRLSDLTSVITDV